MTSFFLQAITAIGDALLGRGDHAVTVPPMDGALQPNQALETARGLLSIDQPDNLAAAGDAVFLSSGQALYRWDGGASPCEVVKTFPAAITCVAALPDGSLVVGTESGEISFLGGDQDGRTLTQLGDYRSFCPTAIISAGGGQIIVAEGSAHHRPGAWRRSLMSRDRSGSVWRLDPKGGGAKCLAHSLAYPSGLSLHPSGGLVVSESWRHRLLRVPFDGGASAVLVADLPGYPGRLSPSWDGGYWLCVFAPRSQLVEFVLREPKYLSRMMSEVPESYWVAPSLASGRDFREPLQGGAIKSMGILKPWAPTRSYGLVVKLDRSYLPVDSMHSRADGRRHGVTSALEWRGELYVASRGGDQIVAVSR
ncbi:MAG: strictosidine synthase [Pseudomonadota bacterium]